MQQLQWCPTAVLANLRDSNVKLDVESEGKWTQKAGTIQLPRKITAIAEGRLGNSNI